jgi:hypothetical protein
VLRLGCSVTDGGASTVNCTIPIDCTIGEITVPRFHQIGCIMGRVADKFGELKERCLELAGYIKDHTKVHNPVKEGMKAIQLALGALEDAFTEEGADCPAPVKRTIESQTSPERPVRGTAESLQRKDPAAFLPKLPATEWTMVGRKKVSSKVSSKINKTGDQKEGADCPAPVKRTIESQTSAERPVRGTAESLQRKDPAASLPKLPATECTMAGRKKVSSKVSSKITKTGDQKEGADCPAPVKRTIESQTSAERPVRGTAESLQRKDPAASLPKWTMVGRKKVSSKVSSKINITGDQNVLHLKEKRDRAPPQKQVLPMVSKKSKENRSYLKRRPLEAIVVARDAPNKSLPTSFADVLRRVHIAAKSTDVDVKSIKRTQKGELVFRLKRGGEGADKLHALVTEAAGPGAVIRRVTPSLVVMISDLDEGIISKDVTNAVNREINEERSGQVQVLNLRPAHSGTQMCVVRIPHTTKSRALLKEGRIKIGLVRCRVRERVELLRCFRCMAFGHAAARCKEPDRSRMCRGCGQNGHKAATCTNKPRCVLCVQRGGSSVAAAAHVCGSSQCKAFKAELARVKSKY